MSIRLGLPPLRNLKSKLFPDASSYNLLEQSSGNKFYIFLNPASLAETN